MAHVRDVIGWFAKPLATNWILGIAGGPVVAALPVGLLWVSLAVERQLNPDCGGSCVMSALGWIFLLSMLVSVPLGIAMAGAGILGALRAFRLRAKHL